MIFILVAVVVAVGIFAAQVYAQFADQLRPHPAAEIARTFFENDIADFHDLGGGGGFRADNGAYKGCDIYFVCDRPILKNAARFKEIGEKDKREILKSIAENDSALSSHFRQDKDLHILIGQTDLGNAMLISNAKTKYCFFGPPGIGVAIHALGYQMRQAEQSAVGSPSSKQDP
ncbi:MAG: hypothetical protein K2W95_12835 [Candidatus Obscuribacterales bacterium]|nr:hypothetical protein [Candidatus Obscuribacterales bacterium]